MRYREVKKNVLHHTPPEDLVFMKIGDEGRDPKFVWKHSREFEYKGAMYDIVYSDRCDQFLYVWCWKDDQDTRLSRMLMEMISGMDRRSMPFQRSTIHLWGFYCKVFFQADEGPLEVETGEDEKSVFYYSMLKDQFCRARVVPPPLFA